MERLSQNLNSNLANWKTLGDIQQGDKITVSKNKVEIVKSGSLQGLFRNTFSPIDEQSTVKSIGNIQRKTFIDLQTLKEDIKTAPPLDMKKNTELLNHLNQLKSCIRESNVGLNQLYLTYSSGSSDQHHEVSLREQFKTQIEANSGLIEEINESIGKVLIDKVLISSENTNDETNTAYKGVDQVKEYAVGKGVNTQLDQDNIPQQFSLDFPRAPSFSLNNQILRSNSLRIETNTVKAYEEMLKVLGNDHAVLALMNLTTQGMFADPIEHIQEEGMNKFGTAIAAARIEHENIPFTIDVSVSEDKVKITLKNGYSLRDADNPSDILGHQLVKREFTLSLSELKEADKEKKPLTKVDVKDSYSKVLGDANLVAALYPYF